MARRGRKPTGALLVDRLEGSERAKARLRIILQTLAGQLTIPEACAELDIQESMFHKLRAEVLRAALGRLEPRPLGRPPSPTTASDSAADLEAENQRLRIELRAALVREELAEKLPRLSRPPDPRGEKKRCKTGPRRYPRSGKSP
jgi:hypothetical protein